MEKFSLSALVHLVSPVGKMKPNVRTVPNKRNPQLKFYRFTGVHFFFGFGVGAVAVVGAFSLPLPSENGGGVNVVMFFLRS